MAKVPRGKILGLALDIGTTDIKGSLMDISSKRELAQANVPNEQKAFGGDVITRLSLATKKGGLEKLNNKVISAVNGLLTQLTKSASQDRRDIKKIVAVGNSAMYHLILMIKPDALARAPFMPSATVSQERNARAMGINVGGNATFTFLPNISGFIGSDILAAILTTGLHRDKGYNLIMDIGTNGEIALGCEKRIFVTSCASGPALEGRYISCGMPAMTGAITHASFTNKFSFATIGNVAPKGISGSGLIDIISILLDRKVIDRTGRMDKKEHVLYEKAGKKIYLTQKDVREIQLAKGALSAGAEILRKEAKIDLKDLRHFYITGTFGTAVNKKNAKNIGLIPDKIPLNKVIFSKNGALAGAKKVLVSPSCESEIDNILARCEHVELHKNPAFEDTFAEAMRF